MSDDWKELALMNILHILSSDDGYGSALCFKELLTMETNDKSIVPVVVTPKHNLINDFCNTLGIINYSISYGQVQIPKHDNSVAFLLKYSIHAFDYYIREQKAEKALAEIIKKHSIDVIHTNSCVIDTGALTAKKAGIRHVWHLREFGKEDFNFFPVKPHMNSLMNKCTTRFIAVSNAVRNAWIGRGIDKNKVAVLYDGVDASLFKYKHSTSDHSKIRIVMTGSFCEAKDQLRLVKALTHLKDIIDRLDISFYGKTEGDYYETVQELVVENSLSEHVHFKGYSNNIPRELSNYHVGVLCSRAEAFGRVTVEYMLSGLCVIAPKSGANIELLEKDACGLLYDKDDPLSLANEIRYLVSNQEVIDKMGSTARIIAEEKYDIRKNATQIIDLFKCV